MKDFLKSWIPKIKNYGLELDKLAKLYNQPWVLVNELNDFVKIIFLDNGKLAVSKNGIVSDGCWELMFVANSILLNINGEKRLYNHQFIDEGLMILKLDGHSIDFFVLANQNIIPDLDVERYLNSRYSTPALTHDFQGKKCLYEKELSLLDGSILQVVSDLGYSGSTEVRINHQVPEDGFYFLSNSDVAYEVLAGKIKMEYYIEEYKQEDGNVIKVGGSRTNGIGSNCPVWLDRRLAPDGEYKKGWFTKIIVKKGRIV